MNRSENVLSGASVYRAITAAAIEESMPPDRYAPTWTSLRRNRSRTASMSRSRRRAACLSRLSGDSSPRLGKVTDQYTCTRDPDSSTTAVPGGTCSMTKAVCGATGLQNVTVSAMPAGSSARGTSGSASRAHIRTRRRFHLRPSRRKGAARRADLEPAQVGEPACPTVRSPTVR